MPIHSIIWSLLLLGRLAASFSVSGVISLQGDQNIADSVTVSDDSVLNIYGGNNYEFTNDILVGRSIMYVGKDDYFSSLREPSNDANVFHFLVKNTNNLQTNGEFVIESPQTSSTCADVDIEMYPTNFENDGTFEIKTGGIPNMCCSRKVVIAAQNFVNNGHFMYNVITPTGSTLYSDCKTDLELGTPTTVILNNNLWQISGAVNVQVNAPVSGGAQVNLDGSNMFVNGIQYMGQSVNLLNGGAYIQTSNPFPNTVVINGLGTSSAVTSISVSGKGKSFTYDPSSGILKMTTTDGRTYSYQIGCGYDPNEFMGSDINGDYYDTTGQYFKVIYTKPYVPDSCNPLDSSVYSTNIISQTPTSHTKPTVSSSIISITPSSTKSSITVSSTKSTPRTSKTTSKFPTNSISSHSIEPSSVTDYPSHISNNYTHISTSSSASIQTSMSSNITSYSFTNSDSSSPGNSSAIITSTHSSSKAFSTSTESYSTSPSTNNGSYSPTMSSSQYAQNPTGILPTISGSQGPHISSGSDSGVVPTMSSSQGPHIPTESDSGVVPTMSSSQGPHIPTESDSGVVPTMSGSQGPHIPTESDSGVVPTMSGSQGPHISSGSDSEVIVPTMSESWGVPYISESTTQKFQTSSSYEQYVPRSDSSKSKFDSQRSGSSTNGVETRSSVSSLENTQSNNHTPQLSTSKTEMDHLTENGTPTDTYTYSITPTYSKSSETKNMDYSSVDISSDYHDYNSDINKNTDNNPSDNCNCQITITETKIQQSIVTITETKVQQSIVTVTESGTINNTDSVQESILTITESIFLTPSSTPVLIQTVTESVFMSSNGTERQSHTDESKSNETESIATESASSILIQSEENPQTTSHVNVQSVQTESGVIPEIQSVQMGSSATRIIANSMLIFISVLILI
ncbi:hypothetical protein RNJ44_00524 [Nakaseomyces bracarensis]|uniref:Hyphally-regulated cell wall protein N-terminal domain-containing protein n=1 Tax=Nakaseomyces bracarensis TaxID=273131 RepID=A0ABR4NST7_9SACH